MFANGEILKDGKGNYYLYSSKKDLLMGRIRKTTAHIKL